MVKWLRHHWFSRTVLVIDYNLIQECKCRFFRRLKYLVVGLLFGCASVKPNVVLGVSTVAIAADCITTVTRPKDWVEQNPILGRHPSNGKVLAYCAVSMGLNATVPNALKLSPKVKKIWWFSLAVWEFHEAIHNLTQ